MWRFLIAAGLAAAIRLGVQSCRKSRMCRQRPARSHSQAIRQRTTQTQRNLVSPGTRFLSTWLTAVAPNSCLRQILHLSVEPRQRREHQSVLGWIRQTAQPARFRRARRDAAHRSQIRERAGVRYPWRNGSSAAQRVTPATECDEPAPRLSKNPFRETYPAREEMRITNQKGSLIQKKGYRYR